MRSLSPPSDRPYRVPWHVDRVFGTHPLITNRGAEPCLAVRMFTAEAPARPRTLHCGVVQPGQTVELCLCTCDPADAVVSVAWFRPEDEEEYLWRFVL